MGNLCPLRGEYFMFGEAGTNFVDGNHCRAGTCRKSGISILKLLSSL